MRITENTIECRKQNNDTIISRGDSVEHKEHGNGQSVSRIIEKDDINTINQSVNYETAVYENRTYGGVGGR